jgi:hypothetical protein
MKRGSGSRELGLKAEGDVEVLLNKISFKKRKLDVESHSLKKIHGIGQELLKGAPTLVQVCSHIKSIMSDYEKQTKEGIVIVGHSVLGDIEALGLDKVGYIDTTNFRFKSD